MTDIADDFESETGLYTGWVLPAQYFTLGDSTFLADQLHVDLRVFDNVGEWTLRPVSELDALTQADIEGLSVVDTSDSIYDTQIEIERKTKRPSENWTLTNLTGVSLDDLYVGHLPDYNNWRGLSVVSDGSAIDADITSCIEVDSYQTDSAGISLTGCHGLSITFADFDPFYFDQAASFVQLSFHDSGGFDAGTGNPSSLELSTAVPFSEDVGGDRELYIPLSEFGADLPAVTGIKIHLEADAADVDPGDKIVILAIRGQGTSWDHTPLDFDTRLGGLVSPPTPEAFQSDDPEFAIVRGEDLPSDLAPGDGSLLFYFNTGGRWEQTNYPELVKADRATAHWGLGDASNAGTAADLIASYDMTYGATPVSASALVPRGDAAGISITDVDDTASRVYTANLNPAQWTIEAWIKPETITGTDPIYGSAGTNTGFQLLLVAGVPTLRIGTGAAQVDLTGGTTCVANETYHIVGSYNGTAASLYVNGVSDVLSAARTYTANTTTASYIGTTTGTSDFFDGTIDEVALYSYSLNARQVYQHYQSGSGAQNKIEGLFREQYDAVADTNTWLSARILWDHESTFFETETHLCEEALNPPRTVTIDGQMSHDLGLALERSLVTLDYDGGTIAFAAGDTVVGATSGATGIVDRVDGSIGAGTLYLKHRNAIAFVNNEDLDVVGVTNALANQTDQPDQDSGNYLLKIDLIGQEFFFNLYQVDHSGAVLDTLTTAPVILENSLYAPGRGRMGLAASFIDKDVVLQSFSSASTSYATMLSRVYPSVTPVKGAQLKAAYSGDINLFRNWRNITPAEFYLDKTKSTSGFGSMRSRSGLLSNQFLIDTWEHTYISVDIWVGPGVSRTKKPQVVLVGPSESLYPTMPLLLPNQWNTIVMELEPFKEHLTGEFYHIEISPTVGAQLGDFWVDSMRIARRTINWQVRADSANPWREFRGTVNKRWGAVHLGPSERGKEIQLQAVALDQSAWISEFDLGVAYAELGRPLYE